MIETILFWLLILLCSIYSITHFFLWKGLNRLLSSKQQATQQPVSVIIAARNEEQNIAALLQSIVEQNYPAEKFEIIIANDRSTDSTSSIVKKFADHYSNIRLLNIESNTSDMPHKKNALRTAIEQSKFDILAFTDADCVVTKNWLNEISKQFTDDLGVVAGYSPYVFNSLKSLSFQKSRGISFLRYEEYKNSLIASSAIELNNAFMCTGRNFAYRKKVYNDVGGFEKIKHSISGDDDLFLQLVQQETDWNIRYMVSPESYVLTIPPLSFSQFVNQRIRHVSASKFYPKRIQIIYSLIHLFHLSILIGFFISPLVSLIVLMVKFNIDGAFIAKGKKIFNEEFSIAEFVFNETLLVFYSFLIAPLGVVKNFDWKGSNN